MLVDGGRFADGFAQMFRGYTGRNDVDIVVCTHNDADHADGIIGFLQGGCSCREIWLPARWLSVLPYALQPTPIILKSLLNQAYEASAELKDLQRRREPEVIPLIELYGDFLSEKGESQTIAQSADTQDGATGWPTEVIPALERSGEDDGLVAALGSGSISIEVLFRFMHWLPSPDEEPEARLVLEALGAASRIRNIAREAFHRGVTVRWFAFNNRAAPTGGDRWLAPANSQLAASVEPVPQTRAMAALALTTINRESLVFWTGAGEGCRGVLFTADSDLDIDVGLPPSLDGFIVTAPHHGSEANKAVYQTVARRVSQDAVVNWVRSDGRFRSRPGATYLAARGRRFCTICRTPQPVPKQAVEFFARSGAWVRHKRTRPCACQ